MWYTNKMFWIGKGCLKPIEPDQKRTRCDFNLFGNYFVHGAQHIWIISSKIIKSGKYISQKNKNDK